MTPKPTAPVRRRPGARLLPGAALLAALSACADAGSPGPLAPAAPEASAAGAAAFVDEMDALDPARWSAEAHPLGRGSFLAGNVRPDSGSVRLVLSAGGYDGGEIRSLATYRYGGYEARLRAPYAPGSISAFFLYEGVERSDELDVEIFNDDSRRVMFTVWVAGRQVHSVTQTLPFDPTADHHTYRIEWGSGGVSFLVDGVVMHRWTGRAPRSRLYLMANAWWPVWLDGPAPEADAALSIDRVAADAG